MDKIFKEDDLQKCEWQYQIRHTDTSEFKMRDIVFLKSNPEHPMKVIATQDGFVYCNWQVNGLFVVDKFPPETILHFRDAGLVRWNDEYDISLN